MDEKKNRRSLLSAFLIIFALIITIAITIACVAFFVIPETLETDNQDNANTEFVIDVPQERLDSPDITIEEIVYFEKTYNESHSAESRDQKILDRIFALKHILLGALMSDVHDRKGLVDISTVHAGEFSPQQQAILDWYFALDDSQQEQWKNCKRVATMSEFKEAVEKQNKLK